MIGEGTRKVGYKQFVPGKYCGLPIKYEVRLESGESLPLFIKS